MPESKTTQNGRHSLELKTCYWEGNVKIFPRKSACMSSIAASWIFPRMADAIETRKNYDHRPCWRWQQYPYPPGNSYVSRRRGWCCTLPLASSYGLAGHFGLPSSAGLLLPLFSSWLLAQLIPWLLSSGFGLQTPICNGQETN